MIVTKPLKVYVNENYLIVEDTDANVYGEGLASQVRVNRKYIEIPEDAIQLYSFTNVNNASEDVYSFRDENGGVMFLDSAGDPYADEAAFETFYLANTGKSSGGATPGSVGIEMYLTQSNTGANIGEDLVIGNKYKITNYQGVDDFTNIGASENATDVEFTATGTTPAIWISSDLTELRAPTDFISNGIAWSYEEKGRYIGTKIGGFVGNYICPEKSTLSLNGSSGFTYGIYFSKIDDDNIRIQTYDTISIDNIDGALREKFIELIRN